jgi:phosphatidylglycerol---prolipoprotein diacylglyceryl transferase
MHPILFRIPMPEWVPYFGKLGAVPIYSYGVMLGLSLVVGWYLTLGLAERDGLPREKMANNYVITALVAVAGSRVLYVVTNPDEFHSFGDVFSMQTGGLVVYGGFLGGFVASWAYLRKNGMRLLPWADVAVPSLASGLAITRIGCYLFGCDYGRPLAENAPGWLKSMGTFPHWPDGTLPGNAAGSPAWAEHYSRQLIAIDAPGSLPVHPTQLYESLLGASLLALLLFVRSRQRFRGEIFFVATFAYGLARFVIEMLRDDPERKAIPGAIAEHLYMPLCLGLFAAGFAVSFARMIPNVTARRVAQGAVFLPAVYAFFALRPGQFTPPVLMQLSTSQFIGIASALAVCAAYVIYANAAEAHPEAAMSLGLPAEPAKEDDDAEKEGDEDEEERPPRKEPLTDVDDEAGEAVEEPVAPPAKVEVKRAKVRKRLRKKARG